MLYREKVIFATPSQKDLAQLLSNLLYKAIMTRALVVVQIGAGLGGAGVPRGPRERKKLN